MTTQTTLAASTNIDLKIKSSDVVDAFIARYETGLKANMAKIRTQLAETKTKIESIKESMMVAAESPYVFAVVTNFGFAKFTTQLKQDSSRVIEKSTRVANVMKYSVAVVLQVVMTHDSLEHKHTSDMHAITIDASENDTNLLNELNAATRELNELFIKNNNDLRDIDSKSRQIRGVLAEQSLREAGVEDIWGNEKILEIIGTSMDTKLLPSS